MGIIIGLGIGAIVAIALVVVAYKRHAAIVEKLASIESTVKSKVDNLRNDLASAQSKATQVENAVKTGAKAAEDAAKGQNG